MCVTNCRGFDVLHLRVMVLPKVMIAMKGFDSWIDNLMLIP